MSTASTPILTATKNPLRRAREARGLTQADLASKAGTTRVHYRRIEQGEQHPSIYLAQRIASILGTTTDEIFNEKKVISS